MLRFCVVGAAGHMGQTFCRLLGNRLISAVERPGAKEVGSSIGDVIITDDVEAAFKKANVVIDFTIPKATLSFNEQARKHGLAHIIGTTGLTLEEHALIDANAAHMRIVKSGNFSLGVNLLAALVKQAAARLDEDFDIEVLEMHHHRKIDAPSGTALMLGDAAALGRNVGRDSYVLSREGITGARKRGDIGFATLRGGGVIGDHTVYFASESERLELRHVASDRALFARGAIKAAEWVENKPNGLYSMADVLEI